MWIYNLVVSVILMFISPNHFPVIFPLMHYCATYSRNGMWFSIEQFAIVISGICLEMGVGVNPNKWQLIHMYSTPSVLCTDLLSLPFYAGASRFSPSSLALTRVGRTVQFLIYLKFIVFFCHPQYSAIGLSNEVV